MAASQKKWVRSVKTDSTHPPEGLFKKDPETIAHTLASKKGISERTRVGHEDVDVLHQSRGKRA